jgi:hypothetical protein
VKYKGLSNELDLYEQDIKERGLLIDEPVSTVRLFIVFSIVSTLPLDNDKPHKFPFTIKERPLSEHNSTTRLYI